MPSTTPVVCIPCRSASGCPKGIHEVHHLSYRWRAPKKGNDNAWKKIAAGDWLWDKKAIVRKAIKRAGVVMDFWDARVEREARRARSAERQKAWEERLAGLDIPEQNVVD